jgi:hypothetical protein
MLKRTGTFIAVLTIFTLVAQAQEQTYEYKKAIWDQREVGYLIEKGILRIGQTLNFDGKSGTPHDIPSASDNGSSCQLEHAYVSNDLSAIVRPQKLNINKFVKTRNCSSPSLSAFVTFVKLWLIILSDEENNRFLNSGEIHRTTVKMSQYWPEETWDFAYSLIRAAHSSDARCPLIHSGMFEIQALDSLLYSRPLRNYGDTKEYPILNDESWHNDLIEHLDLESIRKQLSEHQSDCLNNTPVTIYLEIDHRFIKSITCKMSPDNERKVTYSDFAKALGPWFTLWIPKGIIY